MKVLKSMKQWYIKNKRENILGDSLGGNCTAKVCIVVKGK